MIQQARHWIYNGVETFSTQEKAYVDLEHPCLYDQLFSKKMLGTRYGPVGTRFLWF